MKIIISYFAIVLTPRSMQTGSRGLCPPPASRPELARPELAQFPRVWNSPTFPRLGGAACSLPDPFGGLCGQLGARLGESLWPQISVSRDAVLAAFAAAKMPAESGSNYWRRPSRCWRRGRIVRATNLRLGAHGRLEAKRFPLIGPGDWKIDQTGEAEAAGQTSLDRRLDDVWREEGQRQHHPDGALAFALA